MALVRHRQQQQKRQQQQHACAASQLRSRSSAGTLATATTEMYMSKHILQHIHKLRPHDQQLLLPVEDPVLLERVELEAADGTVSEQHVGGRAVVHAPVIVVSDQDVLAREPAQGIALGVATGVGRVGPVDQLQVRVPLVSGQVSDREG